MPSVLSPGDLDSKPDNMDETVLSSVPSIIWDKALILSLQTQALLRKRSTITTKFETYFTGKSSLSLLLIAMTVA